MPADDALAPQSAPQLVTLPGNGTSPAKSGADAGPSSAPTTAASAPAAAPVPAASPAPSTSSARDFLRALDNAFDRLATLKILTVVGEVSVTGAGRDLAVAARPGATVEAASTEVNLLDGHIVNVFSPSFSTAGGLQTFHQSQVEKSSDIMLRNLAELQKLASALATLRR